MTGEIDFSLTPARAKGGIVGSELAWWKGFANKYPPYYFHVARRKIKRRKRGQPGYSPAIRRSLIEVIHDVLQATHELSDNPRKTRIAGLAVISYQQFLAIFPALLEEGLLEEIQDEDNSFVSYFVTPTGYKWMFQVRSILQHLIEKVLS